MLRLSLNHIIIALPSRQSISISNKYFQVPAQHTVDGMAVEMEPLMMRTADEWEFPRDRLTITTMLGAGAFGIVMHGLAQGIKGSVGQINVAVKMVRGKSIHGNVCL